MKLLVKHLFLIFFTVVITGSVSYGQIEVNKPIILTGDSNQLREVKNIQHAIHSLDAVNVAILQRNQTNYSLATGTNEYFLHLKPSLENYKAGLLLFFKPTNGNTGPVSLNVDSLGPVSLKKATNRELTTNDLKAGEIYYAFFDGMEFQLLNYVPNNCPAGFSEINSKLCIETNERPIATFFEAINTCYSINARMCTWGEWYYACQKTGLGLTGMTNNYEWCDSSTNESNYLRVNGSGSCTTIGQSFSTSSFSYRCCFSK